MIFAVPRVVQGIVIRQKQGQTESEPQRVRCIGQLVIERAGDVSGCGAAEGGSPRRELGEYADQGGEAAEQRRLSAHLENQHGCSAANRTGTTHERSHLK